MRTRATVAAVVGALACTSALVAPAAQAADSAATSGTPYTLKVSFSNFKITTSIKVGVGGTISVPVSYTLTHDSTVNTTASDFYTEPFLYRGTFGDDSTPQLYGDDFATCTTTSSTTETCKGTIDIRPAEGELLNSQAGTWKAAADAVAFNGQDPTSSSIDYSKVGYKEQGDLASTSIRRLAKLTANAGPEPVAKGKTVTTTGKLTRADWQSLTYKGFANQPVKLQFRKAGTTTYTTIKTVYSDAYGNVKATGTATYDGYWRLSFAGTSTTASVNATGDYVDVQ
ncbi:hypothetical protein Sipo8835_29300 [Streptomyces ipomoeae]|uniref:Uncharacterized protein n=2 Tax=Streptomyces ipomoeae TaxID=103232 RepID=A0A540P0Z0_9ACTN|nr:hypothetical protein [Streptomyces ipomoeae]EKX60006.1 putative lipoprotein [Streptomyces ipomoeae 91-03]MDX2695891.1 hypothetical protein [Streptomyces ipomoeae]MDX2823816.1 hypothetical protein [Streptomyces ipomoeae]MDX2841478.1 hypothetical protein [Streptomyces ipomoeae]MDX2876259.1 hypothetical protein [Streptomyces ipomoeae]